MQLGNVATVCYSIHDTIAGLALADMAFSRTTQGASLMQLGMLSILNQGYTNGSLGSIKGVAHRQNDSTIHILHTRSSPLSDSPIPTVSSFIIHRFGASYAKQTYPTSDNCRMESIDTASQAMFVTGRAQVTGSLINIETLNSMESGCNNIDTSSLYTWVFSPDPYQQRESRLTVLSACPITRRVTPSISISTSQIICNQ